MKFAKCVSNFRPSPIRGMMKAVANPDIISFAGGMPGEELFPVDDIRRMVAEMPRKMMDTALQYGPTDGLPALVEELTRVMIEDGFDMKKNRIVITTGSTQGMNIVSKLLLDPGDTMLTEDPVFVGSAGGFSSFQANIIGVPMDENGIIISELEKALESNPKFIYITPTFHNPAGLTYSRERREQFLEVMARYPEVMILEDNAYGELFYDESSKEDYTPMKTYAKNEQQIIYCSSFSKIFGPGLRLGWMILPEEMFDVAEIAKQSMDACTPQFSQMLAYEYIRTGELGRYIKSLRKTYSVRRDTMVRCMREYCPQATFVVPKGGFFLWAKLPDNLDLDKFFDACVERGVVFIKGIAFSANYTNNQHIRVSFSNINPETIEKGVKIMGEEMKKLIL
ncbi:MAG: PLP-dependent aminotransferase family protein [bacterium]